MITILKQYDFFFDFPSINTTDPASTHMYGFPALSLVTVSGQCMDGSGNPTLAGWSTEQFTFSTSGKFHFHDNSTLRSH